MNWYSEMGRGGGDYRSKGVAAAAGLPWATINDNVVVVVVDSNGSSSSSSRGWWWLELQR